MQMFDVQAIEISAPREDVFQFVRDPANLPRWTQAFKAADHGSARLQTPAGTIEVRLEVMADPAAGTVDWRMEFPDGAVAVAQSRITETQRRTSIYSFVLHAPPVTLEQLEGTLEAQRATLQTELARLKALLESR